MESTENQVTDSCVESSRIWITEDHSKYKPTDRFRWHWYFKYGDREFTSCTDCCPGFDTEQEAMSDMIALAIRLGRRMKKLEEILTKEEALFVKLVYRCPGAKLSDDATHWTDDGTEYGKSIALWENPEALGLIRCVGSYKWEPTNKLCLGIETND